MTTDTDKFQLGDSDKGIRARLIRMWPVAVLAALLAIWFTPILRLSGGSWASHSLFAELLRGQNVVAAWRCGLWDARWFPGFDFGYGYPFLSFYAPFAHWMSGLWILICSSPSVGVRANFFGWLVFGTAGMYLAGERVWNFLSRDRAARFHPGLMCAMGWLMSPYPMCNVFVRGALAEFASSQAIPWIVWAAFGILGRAGGWTRRDSREWLLLVLLTSVGILSHNFLGMCVVVIALALAPLVLLLRWFDRNEPGNEGSTITVRAGYWGIGLGWALLATMFYWLPALRESRFVRVSAMRETTGYSYLNHYLYPSNLLNVFYWNFGNSVPGPNDQMPLHLGFVGFVAVASALTAILVLLLARDGRNRKLLAGVGVLVLATAFGILLTTSATRFLWDRVPLLQFAQFPWRLLSIPTVGLCLLLPAAVVADNPTRHRPATVAAFLILAVCFGLSHYYYARIKGKVPYPDNLKPQNWDYIRIHTAALDEYGPIWRDTRRPAKWPRGAPLPNARIAVLRTNKQRMDIRASIQNKSDQPQPLTIALNYFPGWQGRIEPGHKRLTLAPEASTGFIEVRDIPPGQSEIRVWFGDTPIRRTCKMASGIAWLLWLGAWVAPIRKSGRSDRSSGMTR
jgi:hypothetical protein